MLIVELKSDALKERHWRQLCRALKVDWSLSELTLGQVWDADLLHNEHTVKDVVSVAQGEMALEEFLKQVNMRIVNADAPFLNYTKFNSTYVMDGGMLSLWQFLS